MNNNYLLRFISAIFIGVIFISSIFYFRTSFNMLLIAIGVGMMLEWFNMARLNILVTLLGIVLISISIASLLKISLIDTSGWYIFTYFSIIWSVDMMAMIGGKMIEGPKLAPKISPNKTISGLFTGIISALLVVQAISFFNPEEFIIFNNKNIMIYTILLGVISQMSDLTVSIFKRKFNIKDTGNIIPGHGGVLDRFDSIILTAPIFCFWLNNYLA